MWSQCQTETKDGSFLYGKRVFIENQYDIDSVQCVGVVCGLAYIWTPILLRIISRLKITKPFNKRNREVKNYVEL